MNISEYPYKYETHLHTSQGSACGIATGSEMASAFKEAGYTGIIVTDHHFGGNTRPDRNLDWNDWCDQFCLGYEDAKEMGDKIGLQVFLGWEAGFNATEFLVYGLTKEWMKAHEELKTCSVGEHYKLVKSAGGMIIHAHPFRKRFYIKEVRLFPEFVDGVEAINAAHTIPDSGDLPQFNDLAFDYAKKHSLPVCAGSDAHNTTKILGGGMLFKRKLKDINDFISVVKSSEDYLLTDGKNFTKPN